MRMLKFDNSGEDCTNCGELWISHVNYTHLCNNCFCPDYYCNTVNEIAVYQSGILKKLIGNPLLIKVLDDLKYMVEISIQRAVPPITWEQLCERQPLARQLFV